MFDFDENFMYWLECCVGDCGESKSWIYHNMHNSNLQILGWLCSKVVRAQAYCTQYDPEIVSLSLSGDQ